MARRSIALTVGSLALCIASFVRAQGNLDAGKSGAQLYASACANCHKSPQSVSHTTWFFGLESFLSQHYTSNRESAVILAAYLKAQYKPPAQRGAVASRVSQVRPSEPQPPNAELDIPRPPADIPDVSR